jgi:hypothetical protein
MSSARDMLAGMGIDADEAIETDRRLKSKPRRDPRICICGHAVNKHVPESGACEPTKYKCPCRHVHAVITVDDTRLFLRKTTGPGSEHALVRGMAALAEAGKDCEWIEGAQVCKKCGAEGAGRVVPTNSAMTVALNEHSAYNMLLCNSCYKELV